MNVRRSRSLLALLLIMALAPASSFAGSVFTNYAGLIFSGSNNVGPESGTFSMSVSPLRKFSGRILIRHQNAGFSGRFDTNGAANVLVTITIDNSCYGCDPPVIDIETQGLWEVEFQLSPDGESISGGLQFLNGRIPDGTLSGKRSSFNRTNEVPSPGKFTFVLPGSGDPANTNFPTGDGFGTVNIHSSGTVHVSASLADRSGFTLGSLLCDDGTIPVYALMYNGNLIQGWIGLTNSPTADLTGDLVWLKPDVAERSFYPAGFTNEVAVVGSRYVQTNPFVDWTNGVVIFQGGNLSLPFTNAVLLNAKSAVANVSSNKLALKIQSNSGLFDGWVNEPSTGERISFNGVVLQKESGGFGYFLDAPLSGQVLLGPATP